MESDALLFEYKGSAYKIYIKNACVKKTSSGCEITALTDEILIIFKR